MKNGRGITVFLLLAGGVGGAAFAGPPMTAEPAVSASAEARTGDHSTPAKLIKPYQPSYPEYLMQRKIEGAVIVDFIVDTQGVPRHVTVARSPDPGLSALAAAAVERWRFEPAKRDGQAIDEHLRVPVVFNAHRNK